MSSLVSAGRGLAGEIRAAVPPPLLIVGAGEESWPLARTVGELLGVPATFVLASHLIATDGEVLGALAEDGRSMLHYPAASAHRLSDADVEEARHRAEGELRAARARIGPAPSVQVEGCSVVVVSTHLHTGFSAQAALDWARRHGAADVTLAAPRGSTLALARLTSEADRVLCHEVVTEEAVR